MALAVTRQLGPYQLHEALGAGGMGQVFRATDTRLGRTVAIKLLRASDGNSTRRRRFEREARAVSRLNHPHICALYDVGDANGQPFLVMEYVEGETLAHRLGRGPLPLVDVIRYGVEIADALDHVHSAGLVHRDLKPANVMLTPTSVKLLDFGVARWSNSLDDRTSDDNGGTETLTEEGTIVGTIANMSPEQLTGSEADARSDIFALGALLYEMATARAPFDGQTKAHVIAAVLEHDPGPLSSARQAATGEDQSLSLLDRIVARCLAKSPDERWQSARDLRHALKCVEEQRPAAAAVTTAAGSGRRRWLARYGAGALAVVVGASVATRVRVPLDTTQTMSSPTVRSAIILPPAQRLSRRYTGDMPLAVSADGRRIAYVAAGPDRDQLYVRDLDRLEAKAIPGTSGASHPFFSPNGEWVAFFVGSELQRVAVAGGSPLHICEAPEPYHGGVWAPGDNIVFAGPGGLFQVEANGGTPRAIAGTEGGRWPDLLPDGKSVLFTRAGNIEVVALDGSAVRPIARLRADPSRNDIVVLGEGAIAQARFLPGGHVVYGQDPGALRTIAFDLSSLRASGAPRSLVDGVFRASSGNSVYFAVSRTGLLVYAPESQRRSLVWVDRAGHSTPIAANPAPFRIPRLSPDGTRIAVAVDDDTRRADVWIYDVATGVPTRLTSTGHNLAIAWTPDGAHVIHSSGDKILQTHPADGGSPRTWLQDRPQRLVGKYLYSSSWSQDGRSLLFWSNGSATGQDLWVLENGEARPLATTTANEKFGMFSPDGGWVAYQSDETGRDEVYVVAYPSFSGRTAVSNRGGGFPVWSRDGRELFYRQGTAMMSVPIQAGRTFHAGAPRTLFDDPSYVGTSGDLRFDVSLDGQRFLTPRSEEASAADQLVIVQNLAEELKHLDAAR